MGLVGNGARERLLLGLLRLDRLCAEATDGRQVAQALLELEQVGRDLEGAESTELYGVPRWLVDVLEAAVDSIDSLGTPPWPEVAGLLSGQSHGAALRALVAVALRAARPASEELRLAMAERASGAPSPLEAIARRRASCIDVPVTIRDRPGILLTLEVSFDSGNPNMTSTRPVGIRPRGDFDAGVEAGLVAAQTVLLRLGAGADLRSRYAHMEYAIREAPAELAVKGPSGGLPVALYVLEQALGLPPSRLGSSGSIRSDGAIDPLDAQQVEAKLAAIEADGLREGIVCNAPGATQQAAGLSEAAAAIWGSDWTDRTQTIVDHKLQHEGIRVDWELPWSHLPPPRLLNGAPLGGESGCEGRLLDDLQAAAGMSRVLVGPPGSGRTSLAAAVSASLAKSRGEYDWSVVRLTVGDRLVPTNFDATLRAIRACRPSPGRLLVVVDHVDTELDDLSQLLDLALPDPETALLVIADAPTRPDEGLRTVADLIAIEMDESTTLAIARAVAGGHPELAGVSDRQLQIIVEGTDGVAGLIDRLVELGGGEGEPTASVERLRSMVEPGSVGAVLTLASRSVIGLATPSGQLSPLQPSQIIALGGEERPEGWLVRRSESAHHLIEACDRTARLPDLLAKQLKAEAEDHSDREVIAILAGIAKRQPGQLRPVLDLCRGTLDRWADAAASRAVRSFLLVAQRLMSREHGLAIADLFAAKLAQAIDRQEITAVQTARSLAFLLNVWPQVLGSVAEGETHRQRLLANLAHNLDGLLRDSGSFGRRWLLGEVARLDLGSALVDAHVSDFIGDLHEDRPADYQLALSMLRQVRGLPPDNPSVVAVLPPARTLAVAEVSIGSERNRAGLAILRLALRVEIEERHSVVLDHFKVGEGLKERNLRIVREVSQEVTDALDAMSLSAFIRGLEELAHVNRGRCAMLLDDLKNERSVGVLLARRVEAAPPTTAARFLRGLNRVGPSLAFAIAFNEHREPPVPRHRLIRKASKRIASDLHVRGATEMLEVATETDYSWGRTDRRFSSLLCEEMGADLFIELIRLYRRDRIVGNLITAVVQAMPPSGVMEDFTGQAFAPLREALLDTRGAAWAAGAAMTLGSDRNEFGQSFFERLRADERVRGVLADRMTSSQDAASFAASHRLALALHPDLATQFRDAGDHWLGAITAARSFTTAVSAFEAATLTLSQGGAPSPTHELSKRLTRTGWSWRLALDMGTTTTRVTAGLRRLRAAHFDAALEAVSIGDGEDRLLPWLSRDDGRSPQVRSDLLFQIAKLDPDRAAELLERISNGDQPGWARLLRATEHDSNPRTRATVYRGLGAAGYLPDERTRAEQLAEWTARNGLVEDLRQVPGITEILTVCLEWGAGEAAVGAIHPSAIAKTLAFGRSADLSVAHRLIGQLLVVAERMDGARVPASRAARLLAVTVAGVDGLAQRVGSRHYPRLLGSVRAAAPDVFARLGPEAETWLDWKVGRRYRWQPYNHWNGVAWLGWQLSLSGLSTRVSTREEPVSLAALAPGPRLFALTWLQGPAWIEARMEADFEAFEAAEPIESRWPLLAALAGAVRCGCLQRILATGHRWDLVLDSRPGMLAALIPGLTTRDPGLLEFLARHNGLPAAIDHLHCEIRRGNFGAHIVLSALESSGLAERRPQLA